MLNLHPHAEIELADRLEQLDHGDLLEVSRTPVTAEVLDLLTIAHQIRTLPPVEPDGRWLSASKRRLMARFASLHEPIAIRPTSLPER